MGVKTQVYVNIAKLAGNDAKDYDGFPFDQPERKAVLSRLDQLASKAEAKPGKAYQQIFSTLEYAELIYVTQNVQSWSDSFPAQYGFIAGLKARIDRIEAPVKNSELDRKANATLAYALHRQAIESHPFYNRFKQVRDLLGLATNQETHIIGDFPFSVAELKHIARTIEGNPKHSAIPALKIFWDANYPAWVGDGGGEPTAPIYHPETMHLINTIKSRLGRISAEQTKKAAKAQKRAAADFPEMTDGSSSVVTANPEANLDSPPPPPPPSGENGLSNPPLGRNAGRTILSASVAKPGSNSAAGIIRTQPDFQRMTLTVVCDTAEKATQKAKLPGYSTLYSSRNGTIVTIGGFVTTKDLVDYEADLLSGKR